MLENRPEDALVLLVETVETVKTVGTLETVETVCTDHTAYMYVYCIYLTKYFVRYFGSQFQVELTKQGRVVTFEQSVTAFRMYWGPQYTNLQRSHTRKEL